MRPVTSEEIERLAGRTEVKRIAVETFLSTLDESIGDIGNRANAFQDRRKYGWNPATLRAVMEGIRMAFR
jgi:hypothetical protein